MNRPLVAHNVRFGLAIFVLGTAALPAISLAAEPFNNELNPAEKALLAQCIILHTAVHMAVEGIRHDVPLDKVVANIRLRSQTGTEWWTKYYGGWYGVASYANNAYSLAPHLRNEEEVVDVFLSNKGACFGVPPAP